MIFLYLLLALWVIIFTVECCQSRKLRREIERLEKNNKTNQKVIMILQDEVWQLKDMQRKGKNG